MMGRTEPFSMASASLLSFVLPATWLRGRICRRLERIRRQLPFLIDLVAMSVESGLPISAALSQAVDRSPGGPLREEFLRALGELKAGRSREEGLTALSDRVAQPALTQFVLALLAIQRDGGSVVHLLKTIAEQQRIDRLVRAEHQAMQAPVKLMLPLVVFIFPGTFAILLYPVISRVIAQGGLW
jgi:tight adherence protein C